MHQSTTPGVGGRASSHVRDTQVGIVDMRVLGKPLESLARHRLKDKFIFSQKIINAQFFAGKQKCAFVTYCCRCL